MSFPAAWAAIVDDAAVFPPGDASLPDALAAWDERSAESGAGLVRAFVVKDTDLPSLKGFRAPLAVVVTGGAGQLAGPVELCGRLGLDLAGLEIAVRDLDDPVGGVRRVTAALDAIGTDVPVHVELPATPAEAGWLAAADEVAAAGHLLKLRTGGLDASAFPSAGVLAGWIDAALDRETPFKCTAGLHHAVRHTGVDGFEHHGFVNVLLATARAWDGAGPGDVAQVLEQRDSAALVADARGSDLAGARRWFTTFGSCSVTEPWADLTALGLLG